MKQSIREQLAALSVPHSAVSELAHITPQQFSRWLRRPELLKEPDRSRTAKAVEQALRLALAAKNEFPAALVVNWKAAPAVQELIDWFEAQIHAEATNVG